MEDDYEGPSLPSNYVTILQLKERWLQQQQSAKSNPHHDESDSQLKPKPSVDSASKIPNGAVHRRNGHRVINQHKPEVDSASTIPNEAVPRRRNGYRVINQLEPEVDSASKIPNEAVPRRRNGHRVINQHKPEVDSASTIPNEAVPRRRNGHRVINQHKPEVDSASTIPNEAVPRRRNGYRVINQLKPEVDSASKIPNEAVPRRRNGHRVINQLKPEVTLHNSSSKTLVNVADNHPKGEKQQHNTDQSNSKFSTKEISSRGRNPRFITDQNPTGRSTSPLESEPVEEKKQHGQTGGRRNQEVREPKGKTTPLAQNVDELHDDAGGDGLVKAVAASVKEINVSHITNASHGSNSNRRGGSARSHVIPNPRPSSRSNRPPNPPFAGKKWQTSLVWVKKGESAPN